MNVIVNGLMTNYQKVGAGPKVLVCLPGWGDSLASFSKLADKLQRHYTVLSVDLPGFGGTQTPPQAWNLEDYVNFVAAWLDKLKVTKPYAFVGHSNGGAIAIMGLGRGLLKTDKLVLVASAGVRNQRPVSLWLLKVLAKIGKVSLFLLPPSFRRKIRQKLYKTLGSDMLLVPHMELTYKKIINQDVQAIASKIQVPTLLLYGTEDRDTPLSYGQLLNKAIPDSILGIVDSGGHFLHQEQPAKVARLIMDFLKKTG